MALIDTRQHQLTLFQTFAEDLIMEYTNEETYRQNLTLPVSLNQAVKILAKKNKRKFSGQIEFILSENPEIQAILKELEGQK